MTNFDQFLMNDFGSKLYNAIKNGRPEMLENCFDDIVQLPASFKQRLLALATKLNQGYLCESVLRSALKTAKDNDFSLLQKYLISVFTKNIDKVFLNGTKADKEHFKQQLQTLPFEIQTEVIEWIQKQSYGDELFSGGLELENN